jgi:FkbM family methyltransferase
MKTLVRRLMTRAIRPHRIAAGPLRGMWLVTSWHDYPAGLTGRTERPLLDWFSAHVRPGETWLDVGAHCGYTAFALGRLVGPTGRVFAFEPVVGTAGCVDQGRTLNGLRQLTVVPLGLGVPTTLDTRQLPTTRGMADSTLRQGADGGSTTVTIARFDWLWPLISGADHTIHGIKIDVQAMELETLEGMRETLARSRPRLVIELHAGVSRERVLDVLRTVGYSTDAVPLEPVRGETTPLFVDNRSYVFTSR